MEYLFKYLYNINIYSAILTFDALKDVMTMNFILTHDTVNIPKSCLLGSVSSLR